MPSPARGSAPALRRPRGRQQPEQQTEKSCCAILSGSGSKCLRSLFFSFLANLDWLENFFRACTAGSAGLTQTSEYSGRSNSPQQKAPGTPNVQRLRTRQTTFNSAWGTGTRDYEPDPR